ncbi:hypothetical protein GOBAR_AA03595 [Gossypium barbadense]|uniref:Uncharacterized protein n=1 Tax=Gossypium barbadense TaxID=3634 RepID=A0A2P5YN09_GOSBA|nr:hypothetical protein GOBAR_AA03595 [Gossypium barbadense]
MEIEGDHLNHSTKTKIMVQPSLQEMSLKEVHEPFSSNSRGTIHVDRRLQIEELDEWRMHKPRTPDKLNLRQNKLNPFPNQLKVGDRVLLDATDPHIVATTSNEEISLTKLSIFPFVTVEVSQPKFSTFKVNNASLKPYFDDINSRNEESLTKSLKHRFPRSHGRAYGRVTTTDGNTAVRDDCAQIG